MNKDYDLLALESVCLSYKKIIYQLPVEYERDLKNISKRLF